jgi:hypothetical protein
VDINPDPRAVLSVPLSRALCLLDYASSQVVYRTVECLGEKYNVTQRQLRTFSERPTEVVVVVVVVVI